MRKPLSLRHRLRSSSSLAIVAGAMAGPSAPKADASPSRSSATSASSTTAAFNQNQLAGLNKAKTNLGITALAAAVELGQRLHPEHDLGRPAEGRPRHRGRLPARRRDGDDGEEVPGHEVRDHRLPGRGGAVRRQEGQAALQERRGPDLRGERGRLPRRRPRGAEGREGWARRRSAPSAASRSRRSTSGSRATSSARRRPCRARRCSSATRRTSSPPTSARRWPRTRSPRARRCSSRSRAAAASAR